MATRAVQNEFRMESYAHPGAVRADLAVARRELIDDHEAPTPAERVSDLPDALLVDDVAGDADDVGVETEPDTFSDVGGIEHEPASSR